MSTFLSPVSITGYSSLSALGASPEEVWQQYKKTTHNISTQKFSEVDTAVSVLQAKDTQRVNELRQGNAHYRELDDSVLYAMFVARAAVQQAAWASHADFGINLGSSRGATRLFEQYHQEFLKTGKSSTKSSPTTTLGNISSWLAQDLQVSGPTISHSITCSTALHAVLNGVAWLQAGLCEQFLVGGAEAALTDFTVSQMKALRIYADNSEAYPCQAMNLSKKKNAMLLGEGAAVACLERGVKENAAALITGIGYANEMLTHNISISADAECFQKSMRMALGDSSLKEVDVIVTHTPGTIKGDLAEYNAIKAVFGTEHPALTNNKWKIGHTFAASGALSLEFALLMLEHQEFIPVPYLEEQRTPQKMHAILINAVGFGGNAVSILLKKNSL